MADLCITPEEHFMTSSRTADLLVTARQNAGTVPWRDILPRNREQAFAVQDATLATIGPVAGWKVGVSASGAEPSCAPLPAACLLASGVTLSGPQWRMRGIEVEVALRLVRDIHPQGKLLTSHELSGACDAVLPVIEVLESRLDDRQGEPLAQLADLLSHGALVLGEPSTLAPGQLDLKMLDARLAFNGEQVANTHGGNPAQDVWALFAWLAQHAEQRGQPLRAGQIVTTGSCTGMLMAPPDALVQAEVAGIGAIKVQFQDWA
jgi:2-keto-4-pentenoate hydratase